MQDGGPSWLDIRKILEGSCSPTACRGQQHLLADPIPVEQALDQEPCIKIFAAGIFTAAQGSGGVQAAFGRNFLGVTSFFTYLGLGLGFLGGGLALPFGIFVLLCQREPEKYLQVSAYSDSCINALNRSHS